MRKLTLSIAAAALATAGVAIAAPEMAGHMMPKGDMTRAQVEAMAAQHFVKMDANGDGKLDKADHEAMRAKMFDRIDADHNGQISRDEFAAMHRGPRAEGGPGAHADHPRMAGGGDAMRGHRMGGHRGMRGAGMMMKMADTNNDGSLSQAEFTAAALKHFDAADANHDGTVTGAEREAAHAAMAAKWKERKAARDTQ